MAWDGPLAVLVNRASASASEIFAAAIQDYGRGVIIGEPTFGKGTVQNLVDLDDVAHNEKPMFGEVKMTIAQFFRINGGSTQLRGVTPDISFPLTVDAKDFGESSYDNALPWTSIAPAKYQAVADLKPIVPLLAERHGGRVANNGEWKNFEADLADARALRELKTISLNEQVRRKERDEQEAKRKARDVAMGHAARFRVAGRGACRRRGRSRRRAWRHRIRARRCSDGSARADRSVRGRRCRWRC